jgi:hypothetical protein
MSAALRRCEQLTEATDDKTRARLAAEAFDALEARFPQSTNLTTRRDVREGELKISEVEVSLHKVMSAQPRWPPDGLAVRGAVYKLDQLIP